MVSFPPSVLQQCVLTQGGSRDFTACEGPCLSSAEFEGYGSDEAVACGKTVNDLHTEQGECSNNGFSSRFCYIHPTSC